MEPVQPRRTRWRLYVPLAIVLLVVLGALYVEGRKSYWDRKVAELCEKEGGVKVFQVVKLPDDDYRKLLNRLGQIDLRPEEFLDAKYVYSVKTEYLVRDGLDVMKHITRVLQRPGPVVLSERVTFSRVGGDLISIDARSVFSCPKREDLFGKTFIRQQAGNS